MNALALGTKSGLDLGGNIPLNDDKIQSSDSDFKEFLSSILLNIKSSSDTNKKTLLDAKNLTSKHNETAEKIDIKKDYNSISVDKLLQFVLHLNSNSQKGNFPTDKKKSNDIFQDKQAINDFRNIKNLKELFEVAKKYDIKITKFDISFEEDKGDNITSLKDIQKYLSKTKTGSASKKQISSETILHISKIESIKNIKTKDNTEHTLKNILNNTKTAVEKDGKIIYQADKKDNLYQKKVKPSQKQSIKIENNKDNKPHITRKDNIKIISKNDIKESFKQEKRILSDKKTVEQKHTKVEKEALDKVKQKSTAQENRVDFTDNKNRSNNYFHQFHANKTETSSNILNKNLNPRPTLEQFVNDLKNEIQDYKPPLTRVKMTLNPKDLGSVDVSIISRGNNLQININANNNTMAIFTQNQAEFKNALVNMGFTNLNMNFSDQKGSKEQQKGESSHNITDKIEDETHKEEITNLELIIPKYT